LGPEIIESLLTPQKINSAISRHCKILKAISGKITLNERKRGKNGYKTDRHPPTVRKDRP